MAPEIRAATSPGDVGRANEDAFLISGTLAVLVDGATSPATLGDGCIHGPAWYARRLVADVAACHAAAVDEQPPMATLAEAIARTAAAHADTCDLSHPGTPSATVAMLDWTARGALRWLVLGDTTVMLEAGGGLMVHTDDRLSGTSDAERAAVMTGGVLLDAAEHTRRVAALVSAQRAHRNTPGGFWVAAADPAAAEHALAGEVELADVLRAAVVTDGLTRTVDLYRSHTHQSLLAQLADLGPAAVLEQLRAHERDDPTGATYPRMKASDDATAIVLTWEAR